MTLRTLNYGKYGIFLIMGNAGFCPSTVVGVLGEIRGYLGRLGVSLIETHRVLCTVKGDAFPKS